MKAKRINIKVETNIKEILFKLEKLEDLLKEANYIIEELASDGLEINIDI